MRGRLQVADRPQVDVTEVGVRLEEHVGAAPLVGDVVVLGLGRPPRQEVPLFLSGWQSFSAVGHTTYQASCLHIARIKARIINLDNPWIKVHHTYFE